MIVRRTCAMSNAHILRNKFAELRLWSRVNKKFSYIFGNFRITGIFLVQPRVRGCTLPGYIFKMAVKEERNEERPSFFLISLSF